MSFLQSHGERSLRGTSGRSRLFNLDRSMRCDMSMDRPTATFSRRAQTGPEMENSYCAKSSCTTALQMVEHVVGSVHCSNSLTQVNTKSVGRCGMLNRSIRSQSHLAFRVKNTILSRAHMVSSQTADG